MLHVARICQIVMCKAGVAREQNFKGSNLFFLDPLDPSKPKFKGSNEDFKGSNILNFTISQIFYCDILQFLLFLFGFGLIDN